MPLIYRMYFGSKLTYFCSHFKVDAQKDGKAQDSSIAETSRSVSSFTGVSFV